MREIDDLEYIVLINIKVLNKVNNMEYTALYIRLSVHNISDDTSVREHIYIR